MYCFYPFFSNNHTLSTQSKLILATVHAAQVEMVCIRLHFPEFRQTQLVRSQRVQTMIKYGFVLIFEIIRAIHKKTVVGPNTEIKLKSHGLNCPEWVVDKQYMQEFSMGQTSRNSPPLVEEKTPKQSKSERIKWDLHTTHRRFPGFACQKPAGVRQIVRFWVLCGLQMWCSLNIHIFSQSPYIVGSLVQPAGHVYWASCFPSPFLALPSSDHHFLPQDPWWWARPSGQTTRLPNTNGSV